MLCRGKHNDIQLNDNMSNDTEQNEDPWLIKDSWISSTKGIFELNPFQFQAKKYWPRNTR
jgi:hypothetical protein